MINVLETLKLCKVGSGCSAVQINDQRRGLRPINCNGNVTVENLPLVQ